MSGPSTTQAAYFDQLLEQVPEGIVLLDADDRVLRINAEFTRLFGYAPDEATGQLLNISFGPRRSRTRPPRRRCECVPPKAGSASMPSVVPGTAT